MSRLSGPERMPVQPAATGRLHPIRLRPAVPAALLALTLPGVAHAHLVTTGLGPVYDGMSHLFLSPDDLLPALAVGLYAGLRGAAYGRRAIFVLPLAWLAGGIVGLLSSGTAPPSSLTTASFLVMGALVASDARLSLPSFAALAVLLGLLHGTANGASMDTATSEALRALLGISLSLFVLLSLTSAFVLGLKSHAARIAVRVAGSWIMATGILLLGWSLRRKG